MNGGVWLDEGYAEHPKVVGLSDHALAMEVRAMCWSARNGSDGFIPDGCLRLLTTSSSPREVAGELVGTGRWHRADAPCPQEHDQGHDATCPKMAGEGWRIHDFLEDNASTAEQRSRRAAGAARMARSRARARARGSPQPPREAAPVASAPGDATDTGTERQGALLRAVGPAGPGHSGPPPARSQ